MNSAMAIATLVESGGTTAALNQEHKVLEMLLRLFEDIIVHGTNQDQHVIGRMVDMTLEFCAFHFAHEEEFLRDHACSEMAGHANAHKGLLDALRRIRSAAGENLSVAILDAIDWTHKFGLHVEHCDRPAYAEIRRAATVA